MAVSAVSANENSPNLTDCNQRNIMEDSHITEASDKLEIGSSDNNSLSVSEDNILNENSSSETRVSGKVNKLTAKDITSTYAKTLTFSVKVTGSNGVILKNKPVTFKVAGKTYSVNSDDNGGGSN